MGEQLHRTGAWIDRTFWTTQWNSQENPSKTILVTNYDRPSEETTMPGPVTLVTGPGTVPPGVYACSYTEMWLFQLKTVSGM
jgi:hypothetical protein